MQTKGYVGFGISPNGNMNASDVVIGWVKDGHTYFSVSHTKKMKNLICCTIFWIGYV